MALPFLLRVVYCAAVDLYIYPRVWLDVMAKWPIPFQLFEIFADDVLAKSNVMTMFRVSE